MDDDTEDATEWHNERLELMKVSGRGVFKEEAPVITHFYTNKSYLFRFSDFPEDCPLETDLLHQDLAGMQVQDKIKFLYALLRRSQERSRECLSRLFLELEQLLKTKEELESLHRAGVVANAKVVGMTITGASINNAMVKLMQPKIVLVEEAAEILESQLLVALTPSLKHLVMIGDHHQLPPQVGTYELKKKYHFDTSMMQRLVESRLPFVQLTMQNRMRPDIAELLRDIYPNLENSLARVGDIRLPKILDKSSYFWSHNNDECSERSKTNPAEVERVIAFAVLLVIYGHKATEITILCAYLGQESLMKRRLTKASSKYPDVADIRVSTIDNYQGDENNIVIVSLVRSNAYGSVGFLRERTRRCVAQSRAKSCVIFVGNESTVRHADCWKPLLDGVQSIGPQLTVVCPKHPDVSRTNLSNEDQAWRLARIPDTLCNEICKELFLCKIPSHACARKCQPEHSHKGCMTRVSFTFPLCGHKGVKPCWRDEKKEKCMEIVDFVFADCKHPEKRYAKTLSNALIGRYVKQKAT